MPKGTGGQVGRQAGPLESAFRPQLNRSWMTQAACIGLPMAQFFPEHSAYAGPAKRVCRGCPVIDHCLHHAMTGRIDYGVWGGKSEADRRKLHRAVLRGWLAFPDPDDWDLEDVA